MSVSILIWGVGVVTGAYLTWALHPVWCRRSSSGDAASGDKR